jgi:hypothetical protein
MEKVTDLLTRCLTQLKKINGPDDKCVIKDTNSCPNHKLIHDLEEFLSPTL